MPIDPQCMRACRRKIKMPVEADSTRACEKDMKMPTEAKCMRACRREIKTLTDAHCICPCLQCSVSKISRYIIEENQHTKTFRHTALSTHALITTLSSRDGSGTSDYWTRRTLQTCMHNHAFICKRISRRIPPGDPHLLHMLKVPTHSVSKLNSSCCVSSSTLACGLTLYSVKTPSPETIWIEPPPPANLAQHCP